MSTKPKQKKDSKRPEFLKHVDQSDLDINEYLKSMLGQEPMGSYAKRRWRFLISVAKFIHEEKIVNFDDLVRWVAKNCECMRVRTIKEGYVEYLAILGILEWDENAKVVKWKGEGFKNDQ